MDPLKTVPEEKRTMLMRQWAKVIAPPPGERGMMAHDLAWYALLYAADWIDQLRARVAELEAAAQQAERDYADGLTQMATRHAKEYGACVRDANEQAARAITAEKRIAELEAKMQPAQVLAEAERLLRAAGSAHAADG